MFARRASKGRTAEVVGPLLARRANKTGQQVNRIRYHPFRFSALSAMSVRKWAPVNESNFTAS